MATDPTPPAFMAGRRRLLLGLGAWPWAMGQAAPAPRLIAATWLYRGRYQAGFISLGQEGALAEAGAVDVPTRAHGVALTPSGHLLAVARRPGDWLLRWRGPGHAPQWGWIDPPRSFNGHLLASPDGRLYTTETDQESGLGVIGVRDARTLEKLDEWSTHGADPHQLVWDRLRPGHLIVANGGILTLPETGRVKHQLDRMDSSVVRLDAATGRLDGQWRLHDPRLSLRHLAWGWGASQGMLGIALQAEHTEPVQRESAPVLALFDGERLQLGGPAPQPLAGYGGDIAADASGFVVSCTRAGGLAHFTGQGAWRAFTPLDEAGALATTPSAAGPLLWAAGKAQVLRLAPGLPALDAAARRIDNHWITA